MNTLEVIKNRVSLRKYQQKELKKEDFQTIINAAINAPTAGNMMLYSIIHVTDPVLKEKLSISCDNQPFIKNAPSILIFLIDWQKTYDYYKLCRIDELCHSKNEVFKTPREGEFMLASADAYIAAQNAVLAAEDLNIGSCYIGDIIEHYEYHKELLNLDDYVFPICMLTLGYYPENYIRTYRNRFSQEFVVFENSYQKLDELQLNKMFSLSKYPDQYNNFGEYNYYRKNGTEFALEMSESIRAILKKWEDLSQKN